MFLKTHYNNDWGLA